MLLINYEIYLILTWSSTCVITNSTGAGRFAISERKRYVPVVTLSTQDNAKLLKQLLGININQIKKIMQKSNI